MMNRKFKERFNKLKKDCMWKACFHKDENCSEKIIKAHSIQNNRVLNKISENGHVYMFDAHIDYNQGLVTKMKEEGRGKATTFTGFCGYHDKKIFEPIEDYDFVPGNKEQEFLYAYRALAKEYHAKKTTTEMYRRMLEIINSGNEEKIHSFFSLVSKQTPVTLVAIENMLNGSYIGSLDAEQRLEKYKQQFNSYLDNSNYSELVTEVIVFQKEYHLAVSSMIFIEKDLLGNTINDLSDFDTALAPLFITIFPQNEKTYVLMSYLSRNRRRYKFIRKQILSLNENKVKSILSNIILKYVENFTVSPKKWRELEGGIENQLGREYIDSAFRLNKELNTDSQLNIFL